MTDTSEDIVNELCDATSCMWHDPISIDSQVIERAIDEIQRLRSINAELSGALQMLVGAIATDFDDTMWAANRARVALAKAEGKHGGE